MQLRAVAKCDLSPLSLSLDESQPICSQSAPRQSTLSRLAIARSARRFFFVFAAFRSVALTPVDLPLRSNANKAAAKHGTAMMSGTQLPLTPATQSEIINITPKTTNALGALNPDGNREAAQNASILSCQISSSTMRTSGATASPPKL